MTPKPSDHDAQETARLNIANILLIVIGIGLITYFSSWGVSVGVICLFWAHNIRITMELKRGLRILADAYRRSANRQ